MPSTQHAMQRASPNSQLGSDGAHRKAFRLLSLNSPDHFNVCPGGAEFHALALARPAFTRSRIIARSNSAKTPIIWKRALPAGVVVSTACW